MKNPLNDLHIFRTTKRGTPPQMIVVRYGSAARAFEGFGERVIGSATGYGYDKVHSALDQAIERLYSVDLDSNGAAGFSAVQTAAKKRGIKLEAFAGAHGYK
jgi:hypothetical protein